MEQFLFEGLGTKRTKRPRRDLPAVAAGKGRVVKIGGPKGKPGTRIYLEGLWILRSGFEAKGEATVLVDRERRRVVISLNKAMSDRLSSSASSQTISKAVSGRRSAARTFQSLT